MNAITFPFPRVPSTGTAASAVLVDANLGAAMDTLADAAGALFDRNGALSDRERRAEALMRNAMVAISHARNLIAPLMVERGQ